MLKRRARDRWTYGGGRDEVRTNEEDLVGFEGVSGMAWQAIIAE